MAIGFYDPRWLDSQYGVRKGGFGPGRQTTLQFSEPGATTQAERQIDTEIKPILATRADQSWRATVQPFLASMAGLYRPGAPMKDPSPWSNPLPTNPGLSPIGGPSAFTPGGAYNEGPNPYYTISNVKNPQIASILDSVLGTAASNQYDLKSNPYILNRNTKDPGQAARVNALGQMVDQARVGNEAALDAFTQRYAATQPRVDEYLGQETGAIGNFYDPRGLEAQLASNADLTRLARTRGAERAADRVGGQLNRARFVAGDSSNLASQAASRMQDAYTQAALEDAYLRRNNLLTLADARASLAGRRQQLEDAAINRGLAPIQARTALTSAQLAQGGQLGNLTDQNTIYNIDTPETILARRLGILGQAGQVDQFARTYGLGKPNEPDFSGYLPVTAQYSPSPYYPMSGPLPYEPPMGGGNPFSQAPYGVEPTPTGTGGWTPPRNTYYPGYYGTSGYVPEMNESGQLGAYNIYGTPYGNQYLPNSWTPNPLFVPGYDAARVRRDQELYG